jgi:glutathione synthase/RimK-type ligase-like ATP-grasp enzyme
VKLILANNQSEKFKAFYDGLQQSSSAPFDYSGYDSLLFVFDNTAERRVQIVNLETGRSLTDYDGVYINGYLNTYELAATVATACEANGIAFANQEMRAAPSLSKLSMYAKLVAAGVRVPKTLAGTKQALLQASGQLQSFTFPVILKRADADRGVDNYKVGSIQEIEQLLAEQERRSLWLVQEFIPNNGFYLVSFYDSRPSFCIFRSLEARPDGNEQKAHMYKPKGGANASLIELGKVPQPIILACQNSVNAMNRQIASVDCLYDEATGEVFVLEVNYNPQLVTVETFKDVRIKAFLDNLNSIA